MGANAFIQYVVAYLVVARRWSDGSATTILILGFAMTPLVRFSYPNVYRRVGHKGSLLVGHVSFLLYLLLVMAGRGPWVVLAAAFSLAVGAGLVFTAGPLQILDRTPTDFHGKVSGLFFTSNFAAWLLAVVLQGGVIARYGYAATPLVALALTLVGLLCVALVPSRPWVDHRRQSQRVSSGWKDPRIRLVTYLMTISTLAFGLMFGSLAGLLTQTVDPAHVSIFIALFYVARLPGSLAAGAVTDRWGLRLLLVAAFALAGLSLATAAVADALSWMVWAIMTLGFQQAAVMVSAMALAGKTTDAATRSSAYSPLFAGGELGVAAALLMSQITETLTSSPRSVLLVFAAIYLIAAGAVTRLESP
jgi:MFS family permease